MNKEEYYALVESLKNEDGTYSDDSVYQLGVALKSLPRADRDWLELKEIVNWDGVTESLRNWVNHKMKKEGILPRDTTKLTSRTIDYVTGDDVELQLRELEKEKIKVRDERNAYKRLLREDAREEEFRASIVAAASVLKDLPCVVYQGESRKNGTEAILMLSDLHIGVECDNYYNKYNKEIAKQRLDKLATDTINYCKAFKVETLSVCNLGDLVQGIIHTNARIECELDVIQQVMVAGEYVSEFLNLLCKAAPKVVYRSVIDNHSRVIANKADALDSEHFSKLIDWFLEERLSKNNSGVIFANDNIDDGVGRFTLKNGKSVMFAHGHCDSINNVYQNFTGMTKSYIDYILLGHYHSPKEKTFQDTRVFVNGSIVGTEQYAFSRRLFSKPSQTLIVVDGENLINVTVDLETK